MWLAPLIPVDYGRNLQEHSISWISNNQQGKFCFLLHGKKKHIPALSKPVSIWLHLDNMLSNKIYLRVADAHLLQLRVTAYSLLCSLINLMQLVRYYCSSDQLHLGNETEEKQSPCKCTKCISNCRECVEDIQSQNAAFQYWTWPGYRN